MTIAWRGDIAMTGCRHRRKNRLFTFGRTREEKLAYTEVLMQKSKIGEKETYLHILTGLKTSKLEERLSTYIGGNT